MTPNIFCKSSKRPPLAGSALPSTNRGYGHASNVQSEECGADEVEEDGEDGEEGKDGDGGEKEEVVEKGVGVVDDANNIESGE